MFVAIAASGGRAKVGKNGAFALAYYSDADGWRFITGKVGENGIKPDTWYEVREGKLIEAELTQFPIFRLKQTFIKYDD